MLPAQATPLAATMTVADAVIAAYNGFPESDTQIMWLGAWVKRRLNGNFDCPLKGFYQVTGIFIANRSTGESRSIVNKAGTTIAAGAVPNSRPSQYHTWNFKLAKVSRSSIAFYLNGRLAEKIYPTPAGWQAGECWQDTPRDLIADAYTLGTACNLIFASTNNAADVNKISDEEILRFAETGIPPAKAIHWPMNEGTGTVCKAYVNGVNIPALNGTLSSNSWTTDDNFGRI